MSLSSELPLSRTVVLLFTNGLRKQQIELARAVGRTHKEIRSFPDSGPGDVIDESCGNASKEAVLTTYTHNRTQLRKVEAALERIATGDFGTCAACGGAIGLKRLKAMPWVNNCIKCQEQYEQDRVH